MTMTRLEAVLATLDEQASQADLQVDRAQRFAQESEQLRVTGYSPNKTAVVTVDGVGQPVDITFGGSWDQLDAVRLGAAVLEAHAQAKRRLAFHIEQLGEQIYGPGSASAQMVAQSYRDRFGYEEDER